MEDSRSCNIINNYYKPGPITPEREIAHRIFRPDGKRGPEKNSPQRWGHAYVTGNVVQGNEAVSHDNWAGGVHIEGASDPAKILSEVRASTPFPMAPLPMQPAAEAYSAVLDNVGAILPKRDPVDQRIIDHVRKGTVTEGTQQGIIKDVKQVGGYPAYSGSPVKDSDGDGIPDEWERQHGLNPNDASDAAKDSTGDGYSNLENTSTASICDQGQLEGPAQ